MAKSPTGKSKAKSRIRKMVTEGVAHIHATFNNTIITISDITPIPHNGCRPPKRRRV
ncbi:MAG: hypothetical protein OXU22_07485 [Gammaproteobacteria bacterium]|nr:hypothetical protein [Gammaproteobacteria bacterium]